MSAEELNEYIFTWRIKNYSSCYLVKNEYFSSPSFTLESIPDSEWCLRLYPKGDSKEDDESFISVFLSWISSNEKAVVNVSFGIDIVDEKDLVLQYLQSHHEFQRPHISWGWDEFIAVRELEKLLSNSAEDVLTIRCRIEIHNMHKQKISGSSACTTIEVDRCCAQWSVEMPSLIEYSERLTFQISDVDDLEIILNSVEEKMAISIHFRDDNEYKSSQQLTFTFSLFDTKGCMLGLKRAGHFYNLSETWNFPDFMTKELLKWCEVNSSHYEFILECEVRISKRSMSSSIEGLKFVSPCSLKSIRRNMSTLTIQNNFRKLFMDKTYSDVTIRCKTDVFPLHKLVLKVKSPVFAAMFDGDKENKIDVVDVTDTDGETLKAFLEYFYTETVGKMDYKMAKNLMLTADKYQVRSLVDECASFLKPILSTENVCEVIAIADVTGCEHLKSCALNFIKVNASKMLTTSAWLEWTEGNIKLATYILTELSTTIGINNYKFV